MTFGALGNAAMALAEPDAFHQFGLTAPMLLVTALLYGLTAGATAVGLWRVAPWTLKAFMAWSIVAIAGSFVIGIKLDMPGMPSWMPLASAVLLSAILIPIALYIRRRIRAPV